jgi:hypothetical protein
MDFKVKKECLACSKNIWELRDGSLRELFGQIQENVVTPQLTGGFGQ